MYWDNIFIFLIVFISFFNNSKQKTNYCYLQPQICAWVHVLAKIFAFLITNLFVLSTFYGTPCSEGVGRLQLIPVCLSQRTVKQFIRNMFKECICSMTMHKLKNLHQALALILPALSVKKKKKRPLIDLCISNRDSRFYVQTLGIVGY